MGLENFILTCEKDNEELRKDVNYYKNMASRLKKENQELNKKYVNAVSDYETTMAEKEQLNSLVNGCQEEIRQLKKQLEEHKNIYIKKVNNFLAEDVEPDPEDLYMAELEQRAMDCEVMEIQQKEFIKWLEDNIKHYKDFIKSNGKDMTEQDHRRFEIRLTTYEEILQKYKEITGDVKNENNNV